MDPGASPIRDGAGLMRLLGLGPTAARGALRARLSPPLDPRANARLLAALNRWGTTPALGYAGGAARHPDDPAVIDLDDPVPIVTFAEAEHRTRAAATALHERGYGPGTRVGLLGRNSRAYTEALAAIGRTGADTYYLNTGHSAAQLARVAEREGITEYLADPALADRCPTSATVTLAGGDWEDFAAGPVTAPGKPPATGRHVILTSGTTGVPRGAARTSAPIESVVALLDAFPFKQRDTHLIAAPLFHAWGWMHHRLCALLDSTQILLRRPDPLRVLRVAAERRVPVIVTVPVVAQRMAQLPPEMTADLDLSALRVVAISGAPMPPPLVRRFSDRYGDVLYNLYGSTEAAFATVANPADLRDDPGSAGRALPGVTVAILDEDDRELPPGRSGRIFVGSTTSFEGYTDGSDRNRVGGLVWTGDLGVIDEHNRLRVMGRVDDVMIIGGENVHPLEVEEVLRHHPAVLDVAVVPRSDPDFGQRAVAHLVLDGEPDQEFAERFLAWAADRLAPAQRPAAVEVHESLPRNAAGKVLRRDLQQPH
jgi:acyl-CoA synthetase (AMP-forming)/AMP-acid ligase II